MDLCVTADDYGMSAGANAAIEALAGAGRLSAVSVMAHRDAALDTLGRLRGTGVAVGLHLCLTHERPLVRGLGERLPAGYRRLFAAVALRPSLPGLLEAEAAAQADRLLAAGVTIDFVNGHEHVHLFPALWPMVVRLVRRIGARAIRASLGQRIDASADGVVAAAARLAWTFAPLDDRMVLSSIGTGRAGALDLDAIGVLLARPFTAAPGRVRELCIHPALDDPGRRAEHDLLAAGRLAELLGRHGIRQMRGIGGSSR